MIVLKYDCMDHDVNVIRIGYSQRMIRKKIHYIATHETSQNGWLNAFKWNKQHDYFPMKKILQKKCDYQKEKKLIMI